MPFERDWEVTDLEREKERKNLSKDEKSSEKLSDLTSKKEKMSEEEEALKEKLEEKYAKFQELVEEGKEEEDEEVKKLEAQTQVIMSRLEEVEKDIGNTQQEIKKAVKKIKDEEKRQFRREKKPIIFIDEDERVLEEEEEEQEIVKQETPEEKIENIDKELMLEAVKEYDKEERKVVKVVKKKISLIEEMKKLIGELEDVQSEFVNALYKLSDDFPMYEESYERLEFSLVTVEVNKHLQETCIRIKNLATIVMVYCAKEEGMNGGDENKIFEPIYIKGICNYIMKRIIANILFLSSGSVIPLLQRLESYLIMMEALMKKLGLEEIPEELLAKPLHQYDFIWDYRKVKSVFSGHVEFETEDVMNLLIDLYRLKGELKLLMAREEIKALAMRKPEIVIAIGAFEDRFEILHKMLLRSTFGSHYIDYFHLTNEMIIILNEIEQITLLTQVPFLYNAKLKVLQDSKKDVFTQSILGKVCEYLTKKEVRGIVYVFTKLEKVTDPVTGKVTYPCGYCEKLDTSVGFQEFETWFSNPRIKKSLQFCKVNTQTDNGLMLAEAMYCKNIPMMLSGLKMYEGVKATITIEELKQLVYGNGEFIKWEHGKREKTKAKFVDTMFMSSELNYLLGYIVLLKYGILRIVLSEERLIETMIADKVNPIEFFMKRLSKENVEKVSEERKEEKEIDIGLRGTIVVDIANLSGLQEVKSNRIVKEVEG